ncbi:PRP3-domain-containing protein [Conidiobolus coronatus NRRL 28638]|uniref:PRP3-domain-containing protein n=1 Tax=Conidiobolus coronatus (strain ATCC 28846 / CBS 209.66 / NRRL 28638) TaxID=796925 RepID=A0A137P5G5_CONC2|nr:PRP3-domain-containing protein [Conidiobolus coronatus NRRL 28638]|eukprot:KXN70260.1 PRP3-domain-containing protein [Conidiobolus coronatus NRRL 28638]
MSHPNSSEAEKLLEQKKKELQAKLAAMMGGRSGGIRPPPPPSQASSNSYQNTNNYQPPAPPTGVRPQIRPHSNNRSVTDLQKRILESQNRINSAVASKIATTNAQNQAPKITGGLNSQLHPMLASFNGKQDDNQTTFIPKPNFATAKANQKVATKPVKKEAKKEEKEPDLTQNPYFDPVLGSETLAPKFRAPRNLRFNMQGKFIAQGNQMRAELKAQQLKEKILNTAKKSELEDKLDLITGDQSLRREPPPDIEWWDLPFLPSQSYTDIDSNRVNLSDQAGLTNYIHHPVSIKSSATTSSLPAKPMIEKIRLGLLPPEEPKVKLSNLMRVLANESVQDPTKIEAKVRRDVALRKQAHEQQNQDRKLTADQKRDKAERKLEEELKYFGYQCTVYKVGDLSHPKFKFKVDKNAQQLHLTGAVIQADPFCLIIVEGSPKSIKAYKKLMLRRIKWSEEDNINSDNNDSDEEDGDNDEASGSDVKKSQVGGEGKEANYCHLVWEGQIPNPIFKGFRFKKCPTDAIAKEFLGRGKGDHYWDLAKAFEA